VIIEQTDHSFIGARFLGASPLPDGPLNSRRNISDGDGFRKASRSAASQYAAV
jgi:hypothetical protein